MSCAPTQVQEQVQNYYGKELKSTSDLKTNVCTVGSRKGMTPKARETLKRLHPEVTSKYYGCGMINPEAIEGRHILDLGCGSGVDVFVLSNLVGEEGHVTGVDMTKEQLQVARDHIQYHMDAFGFKKPNVTILEGVMEDLSGAGVAPDSVDVIVSNCVINLAADKRKVLSEAFRCLKNGGEVYFSDIYADQEVSDDLRQDPVLWGEGIGGALYWRRLHALATEVGFAAPRLVRANDFQLGNQQMKDKLKGIKFVAATYRIFKLKNDEDVASAYEAVYSGEIAEHEESFTFDCNTTFPSGFVVSVDASTAAILMKSRFKDEFEFNKMASDACLKKGIEDPFFLAQSGEPQ